MKFDDELELPMAALAQNIFIKLSTSIKLFNLCTVQMYIVLVYKSSTFKQLTVSLKIFVLLQF